MNEKMSGGELPENQTKYEDVDRGGVHRDGKTEYYKIFIEDILYKYNKLLHFNKYLIEDNDHGLLEVHRYNAKFEYSNPLKIVINEMQPSFLKDCIIYDLLGMCGIIEKIASTASHESDPRQYYDADTYLLDVDEFLNICAENDEPDTLNELTQFEKPIVREIIKDKFSRLWD